MHNIVEPPREFPGFWVPGGHKLNRLGHPHGRGNEGPSDRGGWGHFGCRGDAGSAGVCGECGSCDACVGD